MWLIYIIPLQIYAAVFYGLKESAHLVNFNAYRER